MNAIQRHRVLAVTLGTDPTSANDVITLAVLARDISPFREQVELLQPLIYQASCRKANANGAFMELLHYSSPLPPPNGSMQGDKKQVK